MSEESQAILKLGVPKGSLEDATINLFERAGWKIRKHTRNYFPDINDPEITASLCRVQEIGGYIAAGILDVGITGLDWLTEGGHEDKVVHVADLVYSKTSNRPCRWVLAVAGDSPYQCPQDLAGKRIATELEGLTRNYFKRVGEFREGSISRMASRLEAGAFILMATRLSARRAPCRSRVSWSILARLRGSAQASLLAMMTG